MEEINVNTWEEFESELKDVCQRCGNAGNSLKPSLLFRGQENSRWQLKTTLDRKRPRMLFKDYYRLIAKIRPQIESLMGNEWPIPEYPDVERAVQSYDSFSLALWSGRCPAYAYMAYLRHHGFPSPLLDWTRSPYVAAYFAFNKFLEGSTNRVSIHAFSEIYPKVSGNDMPVLYPYGPYVKTHRRHVLQQSEYSLCLIFDGQWRFGEYNTVFDKGRRQQGCCWKFTLPVTERIKVLRVLDKYNLNAFSLFGSEDSVMATLAAREFYFENDA